MEAITSRGLLLAGVVRAVKHASQTTLYLTPMHAAKGWYREFAGDADHAKRENSRWSSWDNRLSFWIQREYLLQAISDSGFDMVFEQFDNFAPNIAEAMTAGTYKTDTRGTFVGIKTASE